MSEDVHATAARKLRRISQRYTAGRRVIVDVLASSGKPLTIPEILATEPSLAASSVYRNLVVLEQAGVASRVITSPGHARFELDEQLGGHHHHMVCGDCGQVEDFRLPPAVEDSLDTALRKIARKQGFEGLNHRLDLTGTCPTCQVTR